MLVIGNSDVARVDVSLMTPFRRPVYLSHSSDPHDEEVLERRDNKDIVPDKI
jgi:hypothetical protein